MAILPSLQIGTLKNKLMLENFLCANRTYHAYAIGDLVEPYFSQCEWWAAHTADAVRALVLLFRGLSPHVLFSMADDAPAISEIVRSMSLPERAMILGQSKHIAVWQQYYRFEHLDAMWRMELLPENFSPPSETGSVTRLNMQHVSQLRELYRDEWGNAFAPYQLAQGVFYGIFDDTTLVAAAGTHIIAPEYGLGAVGNVLTLPEYRRRGYGMRVTAAVCAHLLEDGLDTLALNVMQSNRTAIRVYKSLGFTIAFPFTEGIGTRI